MIGSPMPPRTRKKRSPATDFSAKTRVTISTAVGLAACALVLLVHGGGLAPVAGWDTGAGFFLIWMWGSIWSLVLVYPSFTVPFATWLLMGFFKTIPRELEDAALIDGASRLGTLIRIVFPISIPGILTVVIFSFSLVVNEFVYAFTFISASAHRTLSTGVYTDLIRGDLPQWGAIMVASLIPSIPLALLYNTFLDRFIAGFTGGAFR